MQEALGTRLDMSIAYHPQTDGQSERINQTLKDMLKACILDFGGSWDVHFPLVEFSYNNGYHSSMRYASFEALYGVVRSRKKGKLAPRFVRPFEIIEKVGPVAYRLDLLEELDGVHDTFHVSNLKKCLADPTLPNISAILSLISSLCLKMAFLNLSILSYVPPCSLGLELRNWVPELGVGDMGEHVFEKRKNFSLVAHQGFVGVDLMKLHHFLLGGKNQARKRVVRSSQVEMDPAGRHSSQLLA
nr:putative reverse transcriptase domain-containing protein [Tanacetum cinerariifolium]